jgi:glycerol-3-phosphate dehydrogenase
MNSDTTADYDVLVIGGGVNGAGVAQAAAAEGYSVLLLEKGELADGTSHASSKLIHGGLRYLESYEFHMVYEALRERSLMLKNAPDLGQLAPYYIPVYKSTRRAPWLIRLGLSFYALLNGLQASSRFKTIPKSQWDTLDGLVQDDLLAVFQYWDAKTDDRKLTRAVMASAQKLGAELATQSELTAIERRNGLNHIRYSKGDSEQSCTARLVVNAGGPWAEGINTRINPMPEAFAVDLIQGTHIVLKGALNTERFYYVESPRDGRAVFVMPWYGNTMVGTTEARYTGDPDDIAPLDSSVRYLLNVMKHYFPNFNDGREPDIVDAFAGARVLPAASTSAFKRSRETTVLLDNDQAPVCSIYGGKLTAWRATAMKVMKTIRPELPVRQRKADTRSIRLETQQ